jgi:hypothetical protein
VQGQWFWNRCTRRSDHRRDELLSAPIRSIVRFPLFQLAIAVALILFLQSADENSAFGQIFNGLDTLVDATVTFLSAIFTVKSFTKSWLTSGFMIAYVYLACLLILFLVRVISRVVLDFIGRSTLCCGFLFQRSPLFGCGPDRLQPHNLRVEGASQQTLETVLRLSFAILVVLFHHPPPCNTPCNGAQLNSVTAAAPRIFRIKLPRPIGIQAQPEVEGKCVRFGTMRGEGAGSRRAGFLLNLFLPSASWLYQKH